jgi:tetratricopeptide (TPR) repeat protein
LKQFESGNYEKCIDYSNKANGFYELGWVYANKGLAQLVLGKESDAIDTYINAITLIKNQNNSEYFFSEIIKDLQNEMFKNPKLSGASNIHQLLISYIKK